MADDADATSGALDCLRPHPDLIVAGVALLSVEFLLVVVYLLVVPGVSPTRPLFYLLPFVWIDVALWALWRASPRAATTRQRLLAGAVAAAYLAVLAVAGGLVGPGVEGPATGLRLAIASLPPGWGPAVLYGGERVTVALLPFKVVGYLTLAYLVYVAVVDASAGAAAGLVGLLSCVSCVLPVVAALVGGAVGGVGALASAAAVQSYPLSTAAFVLAVALLAWRPSAGTFLPWRPTGRS